MKYLAVILMVMVLAGCAGLQVQSPVRALPLKTTNMTTTVQSVRNFVDSLCPVPIVVDARGNFGDGLFDGFYANRQQTLFTSQQLADIAMFKSLCGKDPATRTDYEYGMLAGRFADDALTQAIPFFGRDMLAITSYLGLAP